MNRSILLLSAAALLSSTPIAFPFFFGGGGDDLPDVGSPGGPSRELSGAEADMWLRGRAVFDRDFHRSEGLGTPELNADSCRACHQDPAIGGAGGLELNVSRIGNDNAGMGPFTNVAGGQGLSKLRPPYVAGREEHDPMTADVYEQRQTPSIFGGGFVNNIPMANIIANEDPMDLDMDGIAGRARMLTIMGNPEVGRFGWKAQVPLIEDFVRDAMGGECGITTTDDGRGFALLADADTVADPELSQADLDDITFFLENLAEPQRGGSTDPGVAGGEGHFMAIGCALCHIPSLADDMGEDVFLYSDLLLHHILPAGFRGMEEPGAEAGFFKTPPLWGVARTAPYFHDGRAEDLREAIEIHEGEATAARDAFLALTVAEQAELILFLEDL